MSASPSAERGSETPKVFYPPSTSAEEQAAFLAKVAEDAKDLPPDDGSALKRWLS